MDSPETFWDWVKWRIQEPDFPDGKTTARSDSMSFEAQPFEGASAFSSDNGIMAELGEYPVRDRHADYAMETDLGGGIGNKRQEEGRNIPSDGKGERSYSASGFEADVDLGSDKNSGGFSFCQADFGILVCLETSCKSRYGGTIVFQKRLEMLLVTCRMFPKWKRLHIRILVFPGI